MPIFPLVLQKTYWSKGFFNVTVDFDRFVRSSEGEVEIVLGRNGKQVKGRISRSANSNGTARIFGGTPLRTWFQANFQPGDTVNTDLAEEGKITLLVN